MSGRLYRSRTERVIAGVAGGVADYLNLDPALVRVVWAVLAFVTGGLFLLIYVVVWAVVPEAPAGTRSAWDGRGGADNATAPIDEAQEPADDRGPARREAGAGNTRLIVGLILILLGAYFLVRRYLPEIAWDRFWPVLLVVAGAALLIASLRREPR